MLGRLGQRASGVVADLARTVENASEDTVRQRAAWALGKIGRPAASAADALRNATSASDPRLARLAEQSLETILGD